MPLWTPGQHPYAAPWTAILLENDKTSHELIENPTPYVRTREKRNQLVFVIDALLSEVITDLNAEIDKLEEDFDYRGKLREEEWCKRLAHELASTHKKLVDRNRLENFAALYKEAAQKVSSPKTKKLLRR